MQRIWAYNFQRFVGISSESNFKNYILMDFTWRFIMNQPINFWWVIQFFFLKNVPASTLVMQILIWNLLFFSLSFVKSSILGLEKWRKNTMKNWHRSQICPKYFHMTQEFPNNGHVMGITYNSFIRFALALSAFSLCWIFTCLPMELQRNRKTKTKNIEFWAHLFISGVSTFLLVFFLFLSFSFNFCIYTSRQF